MVLVLSEPLSYRRYRVGHTGVAAEGERRGVAWNEQDREPGEAGEGVPGDRDAGQTGGTETEADDPGALAGECRPGDGQRRTGIVDASAIGATGRAVVDERRRGHAEARRAQIVDAVAAIVGEGGVGHTQRARVKPNAGTGVGSESGEFTAAWSSTADPVAATWMPAQFPAVGTVLVPSPLVSPPAESSR